MKNYNTHNKTLRCLYRFSELIEQHDKADNPFDLVIKDLMDVLPEGFTHSADCGVKIVISPFKYTNSVYEEKSEARLFRTILADYKQIGYIEVSYTDAPIHYESPFTVDEELMLDIVAKRAAKLYERIYQRLELQREQKALHGSNAALRELIANINREKADMADTVRGNIEKIINPLIAELHRVVEPSKSGYVRMLERGLRDAFSPVLPDGPDGLSMLTTTEIMVCHFIRNGMTSKEIADLKGLSVATINNHRNNIRKKLGIDNKGVNLRSWLTGRLSPHQAEASPEK